MRWFKVSVLAVVLSCSGCLLCGCHMFTDDVKKAFGFSNPTITANYSPLWGVRFEAGTNFAGNLHAEWDADSNAFLVEADVSSDVSGVLKEEGERLNEFVVELRRLEFNHKIEQSKIIGDNIEKTFNGAGLLVGLLGPETAVPIINDIVKGLSGTEVSIGEAIKARIGAPPCNPQNE